MAFGSCCRKATTKFFSSSHVFGPPVEISKNCKKNSKIGILSTEATLSTKVYNKYFDKNFNLVSPSKDLQKVAYFFNRFFLLDTYVHIWTEKARFTQKADI